MVSGSPHRRRAHAGEGQGQAAGFSPEGVRTPPPTLPRDLPDTSFSSLKEEVRDVLRHDWHIIVMLALSCGIVAFCFLIGMQPSMFWNWQQAPKKVPETRPIPSLASQERMRDMYMRAATHVGADAGAVSRAHVVIQGLQPAPESGHARLPKSFYENVYFGVSAWNSWGRKLSPEENLVRNAHLRARLLEIPGIKPSLLHKSEWLWDSNRWEGYVVGFELKNSVQVHKEGEKQRSDNEIEEERLRHHRNGRPTWHEREELVLQIARSFDQFVIFVWYPHVWGRAGVDASSNDPYALTNIMQRVEPTRTGLSHLRSHTVVYRQGGFAEEVIAYPVKGHLP